jgi:hypothetical protein
VFHKNNELAGYASVLHAMQLLGRTGHYGRRLNAVVISFGATARGAVTALQALGIADVTVLTHRETSTPSVRRRRVCCSPVRAPADGRIGRTEALKSTGPVSPRSSSPSTTSSSTACCRTPNPLMFVNDDELDLFEPGSLFVDVSCDEGMGFSFARPTTFADPMFTVGQRVALLRRRPQPELPVGLGDLGDQRSPLPFLRPVIDGPGRLGR